MAAATWTPSPRIIILHGSPPESCNLPSLYGLTQNLWGPRPGPVTDAEARARLRAKPTMPVYTTSVSLWTNNIQLPVAQEIHFR